MRISTEIEGGQTFVKCKVGWTEMIISRELKIFDKRLIRGLMKPSVKGERRIEYAVPNGITLKAYLKKGIDKVSFFTLFAQIVEMIKKVELNELTVDRLYLDLDYIFVNEDTREMYFLYLPINGKEYDKNAKNLSREMAYASAFKLNEDVTFVNDLIEFLNNMYGFSVKEVEYYILRECPEVYSHVPKHEYEDENDKEMCKQVDLNKSMGGRDIWDYVEEQTGTIEEEEATLLIEEEEEATILLEEDEEATILLEEEEEEVKPTAYMIRIKTCERIEIDKEVFFVGKGNKADYIIPDNNAVSRMHAEIMYENDGFYVMDMQSTNGTFVDDIMLPANELILLSSGCEITFANEKFEFHIEEIN